MVLQPKVSVIVPVLNVVRYIRKCMDSILNQTMHELEILVVDAASTDGTHEILEEYAERDPRVLLLNDDKLSTGYAKNLGIEMARAPYIAIVESDDYIELDMLEKMYDVAEKYQLDFVKANFSSFVEENGKCYEFPKTVSCYYDDYDINIDPRKDNHCFCWIMFEWLGLYRKEFLNHYHIRHNESPGAAFQDTGFWFLTMAYASRIYLMKESFYHYRCDNVNASVKNPKKVFDICYEYDYIRGVLKEEHKVWQRVLPAYYRGFFYDNMVVFNRIQEEYREALLNKICDVMMEACDNSGLDKSLYTACEWRCLHSVLENGEDQGLLQKKYDDKYFISFIAKLNMYDDILIFGAGSYGCNLQYWLERHGVKIKSFVDNNHKLWRTQKNGIEIISPDDSKKRYTGCIYLIANMRYAQDIYAQLNNIGIDSKNIIKCDLEKLVENII